ncbi:hypothetical protein [Streptomyces sp. NPDC048277]|uniref:hypothetical protein n=1 Tax=Streptomyces sp. NPDC048277 TaxID=3155027 RepID=UPI0033FF8590
MALIIYLGWFLVRRNVEEHTQGQLDFRWPAFDRTGQPARGLAAPVMEHELVRESD